MSPSASRSPTPASAASGPRNRRLLDRHLRQVSQPRVGIAVRRCSPVAAGRERAAGADLRRVGDGAALVLARLEEAPQEDAEPLADLAEAVLVAPRVPRKVRDLGRGIAEAQRVVQVEVLQLVGYDRALGLLLAGVEHGAVVGL